MNAGPLTSELSPPKSREAQALWKTLPYSRITFQLMGFFLSFYFDVFTGRRTEKCVKSLRGQQQALEEPVLESQQRHRCMCPACIAVPHVHTMTNHGLASSADQGLSEHISQPKRHSVLAQILVIHGKQGNSGKVKGKANSEENIEKP